MAKLFWKEKKYEKTKKWLEKAMLLNPDLGDTHACMYLFENTVGEKSKVPDVVKFCKEKNPKNGVIWNLIRKSENGW